LAFAVLINACGGGGGGSDSASSADPDVRRLLVRWRESANVAGYVIHWGTTSGVYSNARDVGEGEQDGSGVASFELELPGTGERNYFALTSYDEERRMSAFSNELSALVP
jgi:hypothetical protein